jgi:hypothetical protein
MKVMLFEKSSQRRFRWRLLRTRLLRITTVGNVAVAEPVEEMKPKRTAAAKKATGLI